MTEKLFLIALIKILLTPDLKNIKSLDKLQISGKNHFNLRINRLCKKYFSRIDEDEGVKVKALFLTGFIIRLIYKYRLGRIAKLKLIIKKKLYVNIVYLCLKIHFFIRLLLSLKNLGYVYHHTYNLKSKVILAADFPSHAFSFNSENDDKTCSSFAEFIVRQHGNNLCLATLDEYVRFSKSKEAKDTQEFSKSRNLKRIKLLKKFSFFQFLRHLIELIRDSSFKGLSSIFNLLREINLIDSLRYQKIIAQINCEAFYILPFSKFNFYEDGILGSLTTFQYSENFIVPPFQDKNIQDNLEWSYIMSIVNPAALQSSYDAVGFVSLSSKVSNKLAEELVGHTLRHNQSSPELPVAIGYECDFKFKEEGLFVAIFDNPSESLATQFARSITGDITANEDFIKAFLVETFQAAIECGFKVLFKPKYSLLSSASESYTKMLAPLLKKYENNIVLVDPYARLGDVMKAANLVVSLPFTSTKTFADFMGIPSFYYAPKIYFSFFEGNKVDLSRAVINLPKLRSSMMSIKNLHSGS